LGDGLLQETGAFLRSEAWKMFQVMSGYRICTDRHWHGFGNPRGLRVRVVAGTGMGRECATRQPVNPHITI
jgi:hypothetical protein